MFDSINNILFDKKSNLTLDKVQDFTPYMVTRYFSFYDNAYVEYCNESLNKYADVFDTDEEKYKFFMEVVPKLKRRKIDYVRKVKDKKTAEDELPIPDFYSKRELDLLTNID